MKIEVMTADGNGKFTIPAGYAFELQPYASASGDVLVTVHKAVSDEKYLITEARPLYAGAFNSADVETYTANSQWLLYLTESETEVIGPRRGPGRPVRLAHTLVDSGVIANGTYTCGSGSFDCKRFSKVIAICAASVEIGGTGSIKAYLTLSSNAGMGGNISVPCGSGNELADPTTGLTGYIEVGAGVAELTSTNAATKGLQWAGSASFHIVTTGDVNTEEGIDLELWGIP